MCSIFGGIGDSLDRKLMASLRHAAMDRGRDGGRMEWYSLPDGREACLGNWRATPTPEIQSGRLQPYDRLVHNGTIANDKELGGVDGEIDSEVLARVLDRSSINALVTSLGRVRGSYALGMVAGSTILLACNYKPIHFWSPDGGRNTYFSSMARHFSSIVPFGQSPRQLPPYSAIDLTTFDFMSIPRETRDGVVVIASAGLDSTVAATMLKRAGNEVCLLHFKYGCRAEGRESRCIPELAKALGARYAFVDLPYTPMAGASPLLAATGPISGSVAGAEFAHEWVPARNLVMMSMAIAFAEANGYGAVALGNNLEEAGAYPDNEEQLTILMDSLAPYAVQNGVPMRVLSPLGHLMKHEIVKVGLELNAPFEHTWSCYRGEDRHCGECGPCFMRRTAFERNGAIDPVFAGGPRC